MYGELGRTTVRTKRYVSIIHYWFKILTSSENKYIHITYKIMLNEQRSNTTNWASLVKDLLSSLGFNEVWLQQRAGNYSIHVSSKAEAYGHIHTNWHKRINGSTRTVFYRSIAVFQMQPYLELVNVRKFCQPFSRLRMSSH